MRLDELTRTYPFEPNVLDAAKQLYRVRPNNFIETPEQIAFAQSLEQMGWTKTGSGYYSQVYTNPNKPYALKVNTVPDRPFAWFAMLTRKFPNPHFPKIGNMKVHQVGQEKFYMFLIEKLLPLLQLGMTVDYIQKFYIANSAPKPERWRYRIWNSPEVEREYVVIMIFL